MKQANDGKGNFAGAALLLVDNEVRRLQMRIAKAAK